MCSTRRPAQEVPLKHQRRIWRPALSLVFAVTLASALGGCANLKLQQDDHLPTRVAKLTTRGFLWPLTFGSSEVYVASAAGEREWEETFHSIDETIAEAKRQSRHGRTAEERKRGRLAHERFLEIQASLEANYTNWRAETDQAFQAWTWSYSRGKRGQSK